MSIEQVRTLFPDAVPFQLDPGYLPEWYKLANGATTQLMVQRTQIDGRDFKLQFMFLHEGLWRVSGESLYAPVSVPAMRPTYVAIGKELATSLGPGQDKPLRDPQGLTLVYKTEWDDAQANAEVRLSRAFGDYSSVTFYAMGPMK